eukprot:TRINITY_DN8969_c0_g1_i1.p1 TRINITY_DN8969_c0_g1~~TRINITY_DN8969_c0_g1_i1.p1  ORF type:complete len:617 (+),score=119.31 TRINITY_DN8969_c0_g1_i1:196-2046(+)
MESIEDVLRAEKFFYRRRKIEDLPAPVQVYCLSFLRGRKSQLCKLRLVNKHIQDIMDRYFLTFKVRIDSLSHSLPDFRALQNNPEEQDPWKFIQNRFRPFKVHNIAAIHLRRVSYDIDFIKNLPSSLRILELDDCFTTSNEFLKHLPSNLRILSLAQCYHVNDVGVQHLCERNHALKELNLAGLHITNAALRVLPSSLELLDIMRCYSVTDEGISTLTSRLKSLFLSGVYKLTKKSLLALPSELVDLDVTGISCVDNEVLGALPSTLTRLRANHCERISDDGLAQLPRGLLNLHIDFARLITDNGMQHLPSRLVELNISNIPGVSRRGIKAIPRSIKKLVFEGAATPFRSVHFQELPEEIEELSVSDVDECPSYVPTRLQRLKISQSTALYHPPNQKVCSIWDSLTEIRIPRSNIPWCLIPTKLRVLHCKEIEAYSLGCLPETLEYLEMGWYEPILPEFMYEPTDVLKLHLFGDHRYNFSENWSLRLSLLHLSFKNNSLLEPHELQSFCSVRTKKLEIDYRTYYFAKGNRIPVELLPYLPRCRRMETLYLHDDTRNVPSYVSYLPPKMQVVWNGKPLKNTSKQRYPTNSAFSIYRRQKMGRKSYGRRSQRPISHTR